MVKIDKWKVSKMWGARPDLLKSKEICILARNPVPKNLKIGTPLHNETYKKLVASWKTATTKKQQQVFAGRKASKVGLVSTAAPGATALQRTMWCDFVSFFSFFES